MTCGERKCHDECSSSSSSKSCAVPCCAPTQCQDHYTAYEIVCKRRSAVVSITSQFDTVAQGSTAIPNGATASAGQGATAATGAIQMFRLNGSGAMIKFCKRRYILTTSAQVLYAPSILATNQRYPSSGVENAVAGAAPTDLVAASSILVAVRNLNGRASPAKNCPDGHTIVYRASPAFVDGAGGWALLYIDHCDEWNRCLPRIEECHPHFDLGKSRQLNQGDDLYLLGNWGGSSRSFGFCGSGFGITKGIVTNHRACDHSGWFPAELVWGDFESYHNSLGSPIVNQYGQLVAVQISNVPGVVDLYAANLNATHPIIGSGFVSGVSTYFMEFGMKCFSVIGSRSSKYDCFRRHVQSVVDTYYGDYYKYLKGFVGIAYRLVTPNDYNTRLYDGSNGQRAPLIQSATLGGLYDGPLQKNLAGVVVQNIANNAPTGTPAVIFNPPTYVTVQGAGAAPPFDPTVGTHVNSNFAASLFPENILTSGEGCYFGDESRQIPPALLTWKYIADDIISFVVRRPAFDAVNPLVPLDTHLRDSNAVSAKLTTFPPTYDYPWGAVVSLPLPLNVLFPPPLGIDDPPLMSASTKTAI